MTDLEKEFGKKEVKRFEEMFQSGEYDFSFCTRYHANILHYAAACGDFNRVQYILECGADINSEDSSRKTALDYAARCGSQDLVQLLIEQEPDPQTRKKRIQKVLLSAARGGQMELVQWLVGQGADIFSYQSYETSALHLAAWSGNLELVQWLVDQGMQLRESYDFNVRPNFMRHNVMCFAAMSGNLEMVQWMAEQGLSVNSRDAILNASVWDSALNSGSLKLVQWLSEQEDLQMLFEHKDNYIKKDVLLKTAANGFLELLKWLFELGIGVIDINSWINAALLIAVKSDNSSLEMVQWLVEQGADVNAKDSDGKTALQCAAEKEDDPCAQWLASHSEDVNKEENNKKENSDFSQRLNNRGYNLLPINNRDLSSILFDPKESEFNDDHWTMDFDAEEELE